MNPLYNKTRFSNHSSLIDSEPYRSPITGRMIPANRKYGSMLATIGETSVLKPPITRKPISINTADIDVTLNRFPRRKSQEFDEGTLLPPVLGGNTPDRKNSISRGRTVVRIHTKCLKENPYMKRMEADELRALSSSSDSPSSAPGTPKGWRDNFDPNELSPRKRHHTKKTLGNKLVEKFLIRHSSEESSESRSDSSKELTPRRVQHVKNDMDSEDNEEDDSHSPGSNDSSNRLSPKSLMKEIRRNSAEILHEQIKVLDKMILQDNKYKTRQYDSSSIEVQPIDEANRSNLLQRRRSNQMKPAVEDGDFWGEIGNSETLTFKNREMLKKKYLSVNEEETMEKKTDDKTGLTNDKNEETDGQRKGDKVSMDQTSQEEKSKINDKTKETIQIKESQTKNTAKVDTTTKDVQLKAEGKLKQEHLEKCVDPKKTKALKERMAEHIESIKGTLIDTAVKCKEIVTEDVGKKELEKKGLEIGKEEKPVVKIEEIGKEKKAVVKIDDTGKEDTTKYKEIEPKDMTQQAKIAETTIKIQEVKAEVTKTTSKAIENGLKTIKAQEPATNPKPTPKLTDEKSKDTTPQAKIIEKTVEQDVRAVEVTKTTSKAIENGLKTIKAQEPATNPKPTPKLTDEKSKDTTQQAKITETTVKTKEIKTEVLETTSKAIENGLKTTNAQEPATNPKPTPKLTDEEPKDTTPQAKITETTIKQEKAVEVTKTTSKATEHGLKTPNEPATKPKPAPKQTDEKPKVITRKKSDAKASDTNDVNKKVKSKTDVKKVVKTKKSPTEKKTEGVQTTPKKKASPKTEQSSTGTNSKKKLPALEKKQSQDNQSEEESEDQEPAEKVRYDDLPTTRRRRYFMQKNLNYDANAVPASKQYLFTNPDPKKVLMATPRNLVKKRQNSLYELFGGFSSSSDYTTSEEYTYESSDESEEEAVEKTGRVSVSSNDSGFFNANDPRHYALRPDCDVNCHRKCERLTANLCGINQKLMTEALSSVKRGSSQTRVDSPVTTPASFNPAYALECTNPFLPSYQPSENRASRSSETKAVLPPATTIPRFKKYQIDDFEFFKTLGKGSFGKVMLAQLKDTEYYYAVKCLKKDVVLEDDDVECTLIERKVLALGTKHPYLCHLFCTFQTDSHLFFVMEYLNGGDLMFHIQQTGRFPETRARFYAAQIISGLKFLHKKGILYRDLKLDNILLDYQGHARIADFGMCKLQIYLDKTADSFCGTPDYMAPEIIKGMHYNQCVDWWSFGVLLYEMLIGQSPFSGCDEDELFWSICNERPVFPKFLSVEAVRVLTLLLEKDASKRLGGSECTSGDIADQPFFYDIHWERLERREIEPPFKPKMKHILDTRYFEDQFTREAAKLTPVNEEILMTMGQDQFAGFSYTNPNVTDR